MKRFEVFARHLFPTVSSIASHIPVSVSASGAVDNVLTETKSEISSSEFLEIRSVEQLDALRDLSRQARKHPFDRISRQMVNLMFISPIYLNAAGVRGAG